MQTLLRLARRRSGIGTWHISKHVMGKPYPLGSLQGPSNSGKVSLSWTHISTSHGRLSSTTYPSEAHTGLSPPEQDEIMPELHGMYMRY